MRSLAKTLNVGFSGPAFSVNRNSVQQSNITGTALLLWDTEAFDTHGNFDNGAASLFTPTVAGIYYLHCQVAFLNTVAGDVCTIQIRKNGSSIADQSITSSTTTLPLSVSTIVQANGTTDNFDTVLTNASRNTSDTNGGISSDYFEGYYVRELP